MKNFKHPFWESEDIIDIIDEVSKETQCSKIEIRNILNHMFYEVKKEISNDNTFRKILLHNFGSFMPTMRINKRIKYVWGKYRESPNDDLYKELQRLFKIRKLIKDEYKN